jgi:hypothetical protein
MRDDDVDATAILHPIPSPISLSVAFPSSWMWDVFLAGDAILLPPFAPPSTFGRETDFPSSGIDGLLE